MLLDGFRKRAEDDAKLGELLLESGADRNAVKNRIYGDPRQQLTLAQRNAQLFVGGEQFGIDLVKALGTVLVGLRRRVVNDLLVIDRRIMNVRPGGLLHSEPLAIGFKPPIEHELRLVFAGGNQANGLFVETGRYGIGIYIGDESPLIFLSGKSLDGVGLGGHSTP